MKKVNIVITDDHPYYRESLQYFLSLHDPFHIIGNCYSGEQAIEMAAVLQPDIMILDMKLPGINGAAAAAIIRQRFPAIKIIGISMFNDTRIRKQFFNAGAAAYTSKDSSAGELLQVMKGCAC